MRLCRRRTLALLAYLAVEPGPHRRESLLALLWPECGPSRAHAYLRNALWELSKSPVGSWCAIGNDTVRLRKTKGIGVDVSTFQGLLARGEEEGNEELSEPAVQAFTAAVDLYRGHFMAGFTLPDSPPFDEWQSSQDEALRQQLGVALQRLIRHHLNRGEITRAVSLGNRWVCLDPLDETVYSRLMTIYSSAGHPDLALRQFELCERTLREQLQAQPRDTTRALFQDIRQTVHERRIVLAAPPTEEPCLPCWPTPFVGRERELDEIGDLLQTGECRVLTLVGYGGSGKTRLAVEALTRRKESEECRVVFVPLADMQSPLQAVTGIMDALSARLTVRSVVRDTRNTDDLSILLQRLVLVLRGSKVMLVLDNAEHVEGMDSIARAVIEGSPDTTLLITSRHRLGLHAEWVFPVRGLGFPDERCTGDRMINHPAVQVFLHTARRISHHFMPGEADAQAIVKACSLLEGSPLAIELAAAWIGTLSCTEIAAEIERGMDFLTSTCADLPGRQRSMRAVFEHSWVLLPQEAQRALVRLSVFRGGFTKGAACEIAGATVGILAALTNRSLVHQMGPGRYDVHQVLRQFAEERLDEDHVKSCAVRDQHARFFLCEVARLAPKLETRGQREAIAAFDADSQNIAAAWVRGAGNGWTEEVHKAAFGLFLYHDMTGRIIEGGGLFEQAARALPSSSSDDSETLRAFLSACCGWFLCGPHPTRGCEELERSVRRLRRGPPSRHAALGLTLLAIGREERNPSKAERLLRESLAVFESLGDHWGMGVALEGLAYAVVRRDADAAHRHAGRSLAIRSELGDTWGTALALMALGTASRFRGQFAVARAYYEKSLAARREFGWDPIGVTQCTWHIATTAMVEGCYEEATRRFREAGCAAKRAKDLGLAVRSLIGVARAARAAGRLADARGALEESLTLCQAVGFRDQQAEILAEQADIALGQNDTAAARQATECALALDESNPHAGLVAARVELMTGNREQALRDVRIVLRHAHRRQIHAVITDIALTIAQLRMQDLDPLDAGMLARVILADPSAHSDQRVRAEAILGALGPQDGALTPRQGRNPESSLGAVAALVLSRVLRSSSCGAAAGVVPFPPQPTTRHAGTRDSYRSRTQGRDVLKLAAVMWAK